MTVPAVVRREQAEEKKYIADADAIPLQMGLGRACLSECPSPIPKHRVFVAEIVGTDAPFGRALYDFPDPCETVGCLGSSLGWDWKTNRLTLDDR